MNDVSVRKMIDISKYEGHTPGPWVTGWPNGEGFPENAVFINGCEPSEGDDGPWSYSPFFLATASGKEISRELGVMLNQRAYGPSKDGEFDGGNTPLADVLLMTDAPLLLEAYKEKCKEVRWLRQAMKTMLDRQDAVRHAVASSHA